MPRGKAGEEEAATKKFKTSYIIHLRKESFSVKQRKETGEERETEKIKPSQTHIHARTGVIKGKEETRRAKRRAN